jgi:low affinity Fe/Cu permease
MNSAGFYTRFSRASSHLAGRPFTFALMTFLVLAWAVSGPIFGYSDTWQLTINTATTIITFLMVFLIQATQNRDSEAIQIKLDEIIRAQQGAHNALLNLEELEDDELNRLRASYLQLAEKAHQRIRKGQPDTDVPEIGPANDEERGPKPNIAE